VVKHVFSWHKALGLISSTGNVVVVVVLAASMIIVFVVNIVYAGQ
jgi:hypothetical protein